MTQQSPFSYNLPPAKAVVLKPLRYCQFRTATGEFGDRRVDWCEVFACLVLEGMDFCEVHGNVIIAELEKEVGNGNISDP